MLHNKIQNKIAKNILASTAIVASSCFLFTACGNKEELEKTKKELAETKEKLDAVHNFKVVDSFVKFFEYAYKHKIKDPKKGDAALVVADQEQLDNVKKFFSSDMPDEMKKITIKDLLDEK